MGYMRAKEQENKTTARKVYRSMTELITGERIGSKKQPATGFGTQIFHPKMIEELKEEGIEPKGFHEWWTRWGKNKINDISHTFFQGENKDVYNELTKIKSDLKNWREGDKTALEEMKKFYGIDEEQEQKLGNLDIILPKMHSFLGASLPLSAMHVTLSKEKGKSRTFKPLLNQNGSIFPEGIHKAIFDFLSKKEGENLKYDLGNTLGEIIEFTFYDLAGLTYIPKTDFQWDVNKIKSKLVGKRIGRRDILKIFLAAVNKADSFKSHEEMEEFIHSLNPKEAYQHIEWIEKKPEDLKRFDAIVNRMVKILKEERI